MSANQHIPPLPVPRKPAPSPSSIPFPPTIRKIPRISVLNLLSDRSYTLALRVNWGTKRRRILKVFTKARRLALVDPMMSETVAYGILKRAQTPSIPHCYGRIKPLDISQLLPRVDIEGYAPVFSERLAENGNLCAAVLLEDLPGLKATAENFTPQLLEKALGALAGIHAAGVLHCDTVPRNLLVSHDGETVWWIDFDVSRNTVLWVIDDAEWGLEKTWAERDLRELWMAETRRCEYFKSIGQEYKGAGEGSGQD